MKALIFGKTGQVARELARILPDATCLGRDQVDLMDPQSCARAVIGTDADVVINAAAWTAVDRAEAEEAAALVVNAKAPGAMAQACAARGLPFLHISTDYVFDGAGEKPFAPDAAIAPLGAYGRTKAAGEDLVRASGADALILRTSWVFSAHGANFVKTMRRLGAERPSLNVVADQIGGPTPAATIASALVTAARAMLDGAPGGTHHFSGSPDCSWADFARAIMGQSALPCAIQDIPTSAYPTPARRPANSRLDCRSLEQAYGITRPDWHEHLTAVLKELTHAT